MTNDEWQTIQQVTPHALNEFRREQRHSGQRVSRQESKAALIQKRVVEKEAQDARDKVMQKVLDGQPAWAKDNFGFLGKPIAIALPSLPPAPVLPAPTIPPIGDAGQAAVNLASAEVTDADQTAAGVLSQANGPVHAYKLVAKRTELLEVERDEDRKVIALRLKAPDDDGDYSIHKEGDDLSYVPAGSGSADPHNLGTPPAGSSSATVLVTDPTEDEPGLSANTFFTYDDDLLSLSYDPDTRLIRLGRLALGGSTDDQFIILGTKSTEDVWVYQKVVPTSLTFCDEITGEEVTGTFLMIAT